MEEYIAQIIEARASVDGSRIFITGDISFKDVLRVQAALQAFEESVPWDVHDREGSIPEVEVFISSEGGNESAGFALYDLFRESPLSIRTVGVGAVMSIATLVFEAGDIRELMPECRVMVHAGVYNFGKDDVQQTHAINLAKEMGYMTRRYARLIAEASDLPPARVHRWCRKDTYFSARRAVKLGLADKIYGEDNEPVDKPADLQ